ncbi:MAG: GIY-YIG nuclease family protein [Anaerolineales bacterium]
MRTYYVYILSNKAGMLYVGVTNDLERRVLEHKQKSARGHASKYKIDRLLYFQDFDRVEDAIAAEKQVKRLVEKEEA